MLFLIIWLASIVAVALIAHHKNLSVIGFTIVAIFLGPLAVLIIALIPAIQDVATKASDQDIQGEFKSIKEGFLSLQRRIAALEERLGVSTVQAPSPAVAARKEQQRISPKIEQAPAKPGESFEVAFGKYWLNRIGVVVVFLGVAFFISYTFRYLNAFTKIGIGYLCAIGFFFWGDFLEKKERYIRIAWGILGGAWGLMYLSTAAMYYIEETRIIYSPILELCLLAAVSFAAILYNLRYRSWIVTSITFILAFITAGLGGIGYSTIVYCAFLTAGIVFLSYRLFWHKFLLIGIAGLYLTYAYWLWPQIFYAQLISESLTVPIIQFILSFSILSVSCLLFTAGLLFIKSDLDQGLRYTVMGILLNAAFYVSLALSSLYRVRPHFDLSWDIRYWFLLALAALYLFCGYLFKLQGKPKAIVCNVSIAFTLTAMAMVIRFGRLNVVFFWLLQTAALFMLGVYYRELVYRIMAGALSVVIFLRLLAVDYYIAKTYSVFGLKISHTLLAFVCAALYFFIVGALEKLKAIRQRLVGEERYLHISLIVFATMLLVILLHKDVNPRWLTLSWAILAIALLSAGFLFEHRVFRVCGLCVISLSCLRLIYVDMASIDTLYRIISFILLGSLLLGASMVYSKFMARGR